MTPSVSVGPGAGRTPWAMVCRLPVISNAAASIRAVLRPRMKGRTAGIYVITGASSGIGAEDGRDPARTRPRVVNIDLKDGDIEANLATKEGAVPAPSPPSCT